MISNCSLVAQEAHKSSQEAHWGVRMQVTVLERTREVGKKILISGGARW